LKAQSVEELLEDPQKGKIIQLLLYKYMLMYMIMHNRTPFNPALLPFSGEELLMRYRIVPGFYFFRQMNEGWQHYTLGDEPPEASFREQMALVERLLAQWISELLDPALPFASRDLIVVDDEDEWANSSQE
jgi:hypothetical protein